MGSTMKESIAEYNNNPGNLRPPKGVTYQGQLGVDDRGFAIFETPEAGRAALKQDVGIKLNRKISAQEFVDKYAPAGDNSAEARENYVLQIMAALDLPASDTKIEVTDENIQKMMSVIGQVESGKPSAEEVSDTSMTEQLAGQGLEMAGQGVTALGKLVAENPNTALGIGVGALANKLLGNPVGAAGRLAAQSVGSIGQGLAQTLGPKIPKAVGADVAARMFQANPAGSAINRGLQSTLARGAAAVGQTAAGAVTGAAALPVLGLTAGLGVPAYMMYKNYARMTPLEREQRLMEAQQAGLPGP